MGLPMGRHCCSRLAARMGKVKQRERGREIPKAIPTAKHSRLATGMGLPREIQKVIRKPMGIMTG